MAFGYNQDDKSLHKYNATGFTSITHQKNDAALICLAFTWMPRFSTNTFKLFC